MTDAFLLGEHGAEVRVPPDVAARIAPVLVGAIRRARAEGQALDGRTVAVIGAIQLAAERYRQTIRVPSPEPSASPLPTTGAYSPHEQEVTVAEAAERLGVSGGFVRRLARSGALPGRRLAGAWFLDSAAVDERRAAS